MLETLGWKTVNPGQDYDDLETQAVDPSKWTLRPNIYISQSEIGTQPNTVTSSSLLYSSPSTDQYATNAVNSYHAQEASHSAPARGREHGPELDKGGFAHGEDGEK